MKFLRLYFYIQFFALVSACNTNIPIRKRENQSNHKIIEVIANKTLVAEVEGMVCKMGCGGAIKKELILTNAVSIVKIDFVEGKNKQTIRVQYDSNLISQSEIVHKVETINHNQFKVISKKSFDNNSENKK